jgi:hypothetical protein
MEALVSTFQSLKIERRKAKGRSFADDFGTVNVGSGSTLADVTSYGGT